MEKDRWIARAPDPAYLGVPSPLAGAGRPGDRSDLSAQITAVLSAAERNSAGVSGEIVAFELRTALEVIERRLARTQAVHGLASGPRLGEYWRLGRAYARFGADKGVRIANLPTAGSIENIRLLRSGDADVALVQSDIALLALEGRGPFAREDPAIDLRALASLYPEALHIVVMSSSGISTIADFSGRRVDLGPLNSGSRHNALAVLDAHGIAFDSLTQISQRSPQEALQALRSGEIDAAFMTIGAPARLLSSFFAGNEARLVPLDALAIDQLSQTKRGLLAFTIANFSYPRQTAAVSTVASTALMLTTNAMPDGEVATLLRWTFDEMDFIDLGSLHGARISRQTAFEGLAIPLHDGAGAYFKATNDALRAPLKVPSEEKAAPQ